MPENEQAPSSTAPESDVLDHHCAHRLDYISPKLSKIAGQTAQAAASSNAEVADIVLSFLGENQEATGDYEAQLIVRVKRVT